MDVDEKTLSRAARRKLSIAAKRTAKKKAKKRALTKKRPKSPKKIKSAAEKAAKNFLVKKITGGQPYASLSLSQKQQIDKKIDAKKGLITRVARKMLPAIKKKERERLRKVRNQTEDVNNTDHKVLTIDINGSHLEVSAFVNDNAVIPYTFKTEKKAKEHCKKVGGKPFESTNTGKFYVEFTKLDGPINEKATSKSQQRLFGMVHAYNNGELKKTDLDDTLYSKIKKIASGVTKKDAKELAKTPHDDLPEKVPSKENISEQVSYKTANEIKKQWKTEYPNDKFTFKKVRAKGNEFLMVLSPKGVELEKYQFVPKTGWTEMNENKDNEEDVKELKAMLDIAKMLSDKSPYFKGRGSKKEYIKMLVHKIRKLSESKKKKFMSKMDAYKKVRKETLPKSRPMKSKKTYDRKDFKKGKYD